MNDTLNELKLKFEVLEGDRRAYYETSQWAIRQNRETVSNLRAQNKSLSDSIAKIKRFSSSAAVQGSHKVLEQQEQRLCEIHKKYDAIQSEVLKRQEKIAALNDQLAEIHKEAELVKNNQQDSPQAREIRELENRLDKAMIKYNEAQSVRKTYEQIVKRLQEERLNFDNQLVMFEKQLKAKQQDAENLARMFRDANHAKELTRAELSAFESRIIEDRKLREKELQSRKELVKQKMDFSDKFDRKLLNLDNFNKDANGAMESGKEQTDENLEHKFQEYEEIMRIIKEATGVSDITEVIGRFEKQGERKQHLSELQSQCEKKLEATKKDYADIQSVHDDWKFKSEARNVHSLNLLNELKQHLKTAQQNMKDTKAKSEASTKFLVEVESGVRHVSDKLELNVKENPLDSLEEAVTKIETMVHSIKGKDIPESFITAQQNAEPVGILQVNPGFLPQFNVRVPLKPVEFEEIALEDDEDEQDNDDIPSRESIKRQAAQRMDSTNKQGKKTKKKKGQDDEEED